MKGLLLSDFDADYWKKEKEKIIIMVSGLAR